MRTPACLVLAQAVASPFHAAPAASDAGPSLSLGGLLFGDAYHLTSHHLPSGDGATGAVLRRGYLTLDGAYGENWFGRLRLEANQAGEFETYSFEADFKDAFLGYRFGEHAALAGLQPTPTFDVIERAWGKRYLMRTPADLQGVPSRDLGVALKGRFSERFSYRAMVGAGEDFGAESGDGAATMLALNWRLNEHWALDLYHDQEERPGETDVESSQVFLAYASETLRAGAQFSYRNREAGASGELASAFAVWEISPRGSAIARVDRIMEPSLRGDNIAYIPFDPSARATMLLAAYEHRVNDYFLVTPNTIVITYDQNDEGIRPESDVYFRLTFFLDLE